MALSDYPDLTGERAKWICLDVADGVRPAVSERLEYGPEDLAFRQDVLSERLPPGAILDVRD